MTNRTSYSPYVRWTLAILVFLLACAACLNSNNPALCLQALAPRLAIPADIEIIRNVEYGKGGDEPLTLDIVRPKRPSIKPMPAVIFVHGGGWQSGSKEAGIRKIIPLAQNGYFCVTINYRLTDKAPFPAQIEDCKCAVRWLRAHAKDYNVDSNHIGAWGSSAGGHLVALLGTSGGVKELEGNGGWEKFSSKVQAVADYFGPTDFLYWAEEAKKKGFNIEELERKRANGAISKLLGGPFSKKIDVAKKASPTTYIDKKDPPFFIAHGENDDLVPLSQSKAFYEALKKNGIECTLHIVKGAGHGFKSPEPDKLVMDFFDKHLKERKK
ncbi:MAG: alpha/beta hydrolase [Armatimonadetes bacterium]|nr:alpha/beta hydrolase [Armatimonadota bacterium]